MKRLLALALMLVASTGYAATVDSGTHVVTPDCAETPCNTYRFAPFCFDVDRNGVCDGYSAKTWTQSSAITSVPAVCNAGDNATATPDINPVFSATGLPAGLSISASTGAITGTPTGTGAGTIVVTCANDLGSRTDSLAYTVNPSGGAAILATGYYVDATNGSDANNGTSPSTAWETVAKVNSATIPTSADVWFLAGTVQDDQQLVIDWNGTALDHVIVGTYYMSGITPYRLTPDNPTAYPTAYTRSNGTMAQINGTYDASCSATLRGSGTTTCAMGQDTNTTGFDPAAVPNSRYASLVEMSCDYCDVQDLHVKDSAGRCIDVSQTNYSSGHHDNIIRDNYCQNAGGTGIQHNAGYNYIVAGNRIEKFSVGGNKADVQWADHGAGIFVGVNDSSGNGAAPTNGNALIEKNDVVLGYGEGIILGKMGPVIVRGNRVGNTSDAPILMADGADKVFEYNLVWGGNAASATPDAEYGIAIFPEASPGAPHLPITNILIRGNMVAHSSNGVRIGAEASVWAQTGFSMSAVRVYQNTLVNVSSGVAWGVNATDAKFTGFEFKNNVVYNEGGGTLCVVGTLTGDTPNYNTWGAATDADCTGANDTIGNPQLTGSGWNSKTILTTPPVLADYVLGVASPALAVGTPLNSTILSTATYPIYTSITSPCATFDLKGSFIDAICANRNATNPDAGALER